MLSARGAYMSDPHCIGPFGAASTLNNHVLHKLAQRPPPALVRQTACPREPPQHGPPRAEAPFVASHSPRRPLPCWPGEAAACGVRCSTAHRGTWLVGHACGCDAAAAASSPPHVRVCVCVCAACVDAYEETWSGGEKWGYGGCVLVPFSCSIHHTTICMSLIHCTHMHTWWLSTLNAVHSLPHSSLCCRFSSPSCHLLPWSHNAGACLWAEA